MCFSLIMMTAGREERHFILCAKEEIVLSGMSISVVKY